MWARVEKTPTCWLWQGARNRVGGHGVIAAGRAPTRLVYVHRLSWELANGPIPAGMAVCHRCDVPNCVRPDHLFLGTQAANLADMHSKGRQASTSLTRHLGTANGRAVLDPERVATIRERHDAGGETIASLAREYGVGETTVRNIVKRRRWLNELPLREGGSTELRQA